MPLRFVLDESVRGGGFWQAIRVHNRGGVDAIDAVRVGDPADLPLGTPDPDVLLWAEREDRIFVTPDVRTAPNHLADHLAAGRSSPGIFLIRHGSQVPALVDLLAEVAHRSPGSAWKNRCEFIP